MLFHQDKFVRFSTRQWKSPFWNLRFSVLSPLACIHSSPKNIIWEIWKCRKIWNDQLGNLKVNCLLLKISRKLRKIFLSPRRDSNPQPSDLRWDALTIELPGLRWQREGYDVYWFVYWCVLAHATYVLLIQHMYMSVYLFIIYLWNYLSF